VLLRTTREKAQQPVSEPHSLVVAATTLGTSFQWATGTAGAGQREDGVASAALKGLGVAQLTL